MHANDPHRGSRIAKLWQISKRTTYFPEKKQLAVQNQFSVKDFFLTLVTGADKIKYFPTKIPRIKPPVTKQSS